MSWSASWVCFYCSNPVSGRHVYATIRHHYKNGGTRDSDRRFHPPCFEKFEAQGGRPFNPETAYEVMGAEDVEGGMTGLKIKPPSETVAAIRSS